MIDIVIIIRRIKCRDEHEISGILDRGVRPRNGYFPVLERLPEALEDIRLKKLEFVEEEHTVMSQADFARFEKLPLLR